ncbi:hypothetical protein HID58_055366 [Brassica napus]|uniref:Uncharacterized protein n=1 Tax=Brassica napus TaxID=3708 RepID=A0ABQ8AK25_BRANA|nr:hypothetical protein HID58_055366 [Brassica napus]
MRRCPMVVIGRSWPQDFSLHFFRLSGSMNRVEECMGSSCLILLAFLAPLELVKAVMDFHSGLHTGLYPDLRQRDVQYVRLGDNLVDSWYRSCMDFRPGNQRLDGLSPRNPEAGWTFVQEPGGWMDYRPGTRRLVELLSRNLMVVWTFKGTFSVFLYHNLGASSNASSSYPWEDLKTEPDVLGS